LLKVTFSTPTKTISCPPKNTKNDYPNFHHALQLHFPGAVSLKKYIKRTDDELSKIGFTDENTMGMVGICRDEITEPLFEEVRRYWGKSFNCCGLGGFVFMGTTGLGAAVAHTPIFNGIRRFVFYAMPHIAISEEGVVGEVFREGIHEASHACGALDAIRKELKNGKLTITTNSEDIEQSYIRQKILSNIQYGYVPDLVGITKLAAKIISDDVQRLLDTLNVNVYHYALMTGVQIHGPYDTTWIYPLTFYAMAPQKIQLSIESHPQVSNKSSTSLTNGVYTITSEENGKAIDGNVIGTYQFDPSRGRAFLWDHIPTAVNHQWNLEIVAEDTYVITNCMNNLSLDGNTNVGQFNDAFPTPFLWNKAKDSKSQQWKLVHQGNSYTLQNVQNQRYLDCNVRLCDNFRSTHKNPVLVNPNNVQRSCLWNFNVKR